MINKPLIILLPLVVFLLLVILFWQGLGKDPHEVPSALIGKTVPTFTIATLEGSTFTNKDFAHKVILLNVWASWCVTCRAEHQMLDIIHNQYHVPMYGLDYKDKRDTAIGWLENFGNPYQAVLFDDKGQLGINLGVYGVPETFVIDKQGIIQYKQIGEINQRNWKSTLWPLVQKLQRQ
jgi:cytochrome c biogenesis protein CcmG/thiol:disulfide interchange protein DsbE